MIARQTLPYTYFAFGYSISSEIALPENAVRHLDLLLERRYLIDHEDLLMSVVVRKAAQAA